VMAVAASGVVGTRSGSGVGVGPRAGQGPRSRGPTGALAASAEAATSGAGQRHRRPHQQQPRSGPGRLSSRKSRFRGASSGNGYPIAEGRASAYILGEGGTSRGSELGSQTSGERSTGQYIMPSRGYMSGVKLIVRKLPPCLTVEEIQASMDRVAIDAGEPHFLPIWTRFRSGKLAKPSRAMRHSVLYVAFKDHKEASRFANLFNSHCFLDGKNGMCYNAVVERAPNQQIPRAQKSKDPLQGTIESDTDYKRFLTKYAEAESRPIGPLQGTGGLLVTTEMVASTTSATRGRDIIVTPLVEELRAKRRERDIRKVKEKPLVASPISARPKTIPRAPLKVSKKKPPFGPGHAPVLMKRDSEEEDSKERNPVDLAPRTSLTQRPRRDGDRDVKAKEHKGNHSERKEPKIRKLHISALSIDNSGVNDRLLTRGAGKISIRNPQSFPRSGPTGGELSGSAQVFRPSGATNDPP